MVIFSKLELGGLVYIVCCTTHMSLGTSLYFRFLNIFETSSLRFFFVVVLNRYIPLYQ